MSDTIKMTADAHARLTEEVEQLEGEGRRDIAGRISTARDFGDLKENAEYHAAKEEAAMLEAKIARIRDQLRSAEIVEAAAGGEAAGMGSTVTYRDEKASAERTFRLVPAVDAAPAEGKLSIDSPVGQVLAGTSEGDKRTISSPSGEREITIVSVEHG
jgi:transcription elongation factor GreA